MKALIPRELPFIVYVVYIHGHLGEILDAMRIIAEPNARAHCHITIRGPYKRRLPKANVERYAQVLLKSRLIIDGVSAFFEANQHTVYLDIISGSLREVWRKKDYGYNPHITIYDGADRRFAEKLLSTLKGSKLQVEISSFDIDAIRKYPREVFLPLVVNESLINKVAGREIPRELYAELPTEERLAIIAKLANELRKSR